MALKDVIGEIVTRLDNLRIRTERLEARKPHIPVCLLTDATWTHNSSGNWLDVEFDTETLDPDGLHSTTSDKDHVTIKVPGVYVIVGAGTWAASGVGTERRLAISLNGTNFNIQSTAIACESIAVAAICKLAIGDIVRLAGWQDSGGSLVLTLSNFAAVLIG